MPSHRSEYMSQALAQAKEASPQSAHIIEAFQPALLEEEKLKALLLDAWNRLAVPERGSGFRDGVPLFKRVELLPEPIELTRFGPSLMDRLIEGFPDAADQFLKIKKDLEKGPNDLTQKATAVVNAHPEAIAAYLADIGVEEQIFVFAYNRLIKPFVEAKALLVNEMANDEEWRRGYCPICGAWPMIGYLTGEGGQRVLVCSFCSHEYGFSRVECPFCQSSDQESLEYIFMDGRNHERLEICNSCRRYIKIIDFRERTGPFFPEIWHIATLNLDLTAQTRSLQHCADNYTIPG